jgi:hypothetical protein
MSDAIRAEAQPGGWIVGTCREEVSDQVPLGICHRCQAPLARAARRGPVTRRLGVSQRSKRRQRPVEPPALPARYLRASRARPPSKRNAAFKHLPEGAAAGQRPGLCKARCFSKSHCLPAHKRHSDHSNSDSYTFTAPACTSQGLSARQMQQLMHAVLCGPGAA